MSNPFHELLQAMREAALAQQDTHAALVLAAEANQRTGQAMVRAIDAALTAHQEERDLRDTIQQLETLVMQLSADVRALRLRLDGGAS